MELSFIHFLYSLQDKSCKDTINDSDDIDLSSFYHQRQKNATSAFSAEEAIELFLLRIKSIDLSAHEIET